MISEELGTVSLKQLLAQLGPGVVEVLASPRGLDVPVGDPVIQDPLENTTIEPDAIVLAVGTPPDSSQARDLIVAAGDAGAAVVAFKLHDRSVPWLQDAEKRGVAVIAIADEMNWSQLNAVLALTLPSLRQSTAMPGIGSVPLGDLFALANALAGLVGGAITIEDTRARVLAYSTLEGQPIDEPRQRSILGLQVPDTPGMRATYKRLWQATGAIRVDEVADVGDIFPRIAAAIRVGNESLGSIWVVEGSTPLGKEAERALEEATRITALHLIHARSSRDIERRTRGDLLRSLLEGRGDLASAASRLGIKEDSPIVVVALAFDDVEDVEVELYRERLVDLVATYSQAFRLQVAPVAIGRSIYGLLPVAPHSTYERVLEIGRELHEHAEATLGMRLTAAVSSVVTELRQVAEARNEAERILRVLDSKDEATRAASIEDVRSRVILLTLRELAAEHPDLTKGPLQEILRHDAEKGTFYRETLEAYLGAFGDIPSAAEGLGVHSNTFRYRLKRLVDVFGLDLANPTDRLVIELQLRLVSENGTQPPG